MPSAVLTGLSGLIRELAGNPAAICASVDISPEALERPDIPIPASAVFRIIDRACEACGCRDFGLRLAGRSSLAILGPLWTVDLTGRITEGVAPGLSVGVALLAALALRERTAGTATRIRLRTSTSVRPNAAASATSCGRKRRPAASADESAGISSPAGRTLAPAFKPAGRTTQPASSMRMISSSTPNPA